MLARLAILVVCACVSRPKGQAMTLAPITGPVQVDSTGSDPMSTEPGGTGPTGTEPASTGSTGLTVFEALANGASCAGDADCASQHCSCSGETCRCTSVACSPCSIAGIDGVCGSSGVVPAMTTLAGCSGASACNGAGDCKPANGQACGSAIDCASGHCNFTQPDGSGPTVCSSCPGSQVTDDTGETCKFPVWLYDVALGSLGATASASSTFTATGQTWFSPPSAAIDGDESGYLWGSSSGNGGWMDNTNEWPDWLRVDFATVRNLVEIDVYTLQDESNRSGPTPPTGGTACDTMGISDFQVQYLAGSTWYDVPNGHITNNQLAWQKLTFEPIQTSAIRVLVNDGWDGSSTIVELEAWALPLPVKQTIDGSHRWADGTLAKACYEYRMPRWSYGPAAASGRYTVDPDGPDGVDSPYEVFCDMSTDGGGWTLVDNDASDTAVITSRTVGAITDPTVTRGAYLPDYVWSDAHELLCKSSAFDGADGWVRLEAWDGDAQNYPIAASTSGIASSTGGWKIGDLNGNSNHGTGTWTYTDDTRINTLWIGDANHATCACDYFDGSNHYSGLGTITSATASTCSTWVR